MVWVVWCVLGWFGVFPRSGLARLFVTIGGSSGIMTTARPELPYPCSSQVLGGESNVTFPKLCVQVRISCESQGLISPLVHTLVKYCQFNQ